MNVVFEPYYDIDDSSVCWLVGHYVPGNSIGYKTEWLNGYTIDDLTGTNLPFNNYSCFCFKWKTSKYRVTKIEFDVTVENNFKTTLYVKNPRRDLSETYIELDMKAGDTQHVVLTCNLTKNTNLFEIENFPGSYQGAACTANWKLTNLFITAEKK